MTRVKRQKRRADINPNLIMQMKFSKICRYVALLCSGLALGGCMLGPNFQPPEATLPDDWQENADVAFAQQTEEEKLAWWTQFNDPVLE